MCIVLTRPTSTALRELAYSGVRNMRELPDTEDTMLANVWHPCALPTSRVLNSNVAFTTALLRSGSHPIMPGRTQRGRSDLRCNVDFCLGSAASAGNGKASLIDFPQGHLEIPLDT